MNDLHDSFLGLCAGYVLDILDPEERMRFEEHLRTGCGECHALLRELNDGALLFAASTPSEKPPAAVKARVLDTIRADRKAGSNGFAMPEPANPRAPEARVVRVAPWARWMITGLAAACVFLALDSMRLRREHADLQSQLAGVRLQLVQLETQLGEQTKWASLVSSAGTRFAVLTATPDGNAEQAAWAMLDPETGRAVIGIDAARAPAGHDFELWAIEGGTPRSLGVIRADSEGRAVIRVEDVRGTGRLEALAVSLERAGGSPDPNRPNGPVVLVGTIRG